MQRCQEGAQASAGMHRQAAEGGRPLGRAPPAAGVRRARAGQLGAQGRRGEGAAAGAGCLALPRQPRRGVVQGAAHRPPRERPGGRRGDPHGPGRHARPERPRRGGLHEGAAVLAERNVQPLRPPLRPQGLPHRDRDVPAPQALRLGRQRAGADLGGDRVLGVLLRELRAPADVPRVPRRARVRRHHHVLVGDPPDGAVPAVPGGGKDLHAACAPDVPRGARAARGEPAPVLLPAIRREVGLCGADTQPAGRLQRFALRAHPLPLALPAPRVPLPPAV
mmetsp:Transcript_26669/g.75327  ORF Transcript_26669/g.75327 Transcript_26669/m.75327 type:complete len:278 (-) Transcript_26669:345-1178(-)